uniref:Dehydrogenase n=1 Tax=Podospora anserina (strain S / ATCC MYA-4624 / DSM 980 / FGSC 10383) TaxID=515849 RepID=A0A090D5E0_PODAN|nr:Putative dehydrogenase [Podospora anserina S mat+]
MSTSPPKTTEAWTYTSPSTPRTALTLTTSHPLNFPPSNSSEETLLISVSHAALNPGDIVSLTAMPFFLHSTPSAVPAFDFCGTVLRSHNQARFSPGDNVICFPPLPHMLKTGIGGLQKIVPIPAKYCVRLPQGKKPIDGAGLMLAGCTALLQVRQAGVKKGDRILVVGASGGVGSAAVQIVRDVVGLGGYIAGVCSGRNEGLVRSLGADEVVDYTLHKDLPGYLTERFGGEGRRFDHVIDGYGNQELYKSCAGFLKEGGVYDAASIHYASYRLWDLLGSVVTIGLNILWPRAQWLGGTGRRFKICSLGDPGLEMMELLAGMLGDGRVRVVRDSVWGWGEVKEGFDVLMGGHAAGKVVIRVGEGEE